MLEPASNLAIIAPDLANLLQNDVVHPAGKEKEEKLEIRKLNKVIHK